MQESSSDIADVQAELLYIVNELRDNNLPCCRGGTESVLQWKTFLEGATNAEVCPYLGHDACILWYLMDRKIFCSIITAVKGCGAKVCL